MTVSFAASKKDARLITQIVDRAQVMARRNQVDFDRTGAAMDITAAHLNDHRLNLDALLAASDSDFAHDVFGIFRHIDRSTGKLRDFFLPRFNQPERERWQMTHSTHPTKQRKT